MLAFAAKFVGCLCYCALSVLSTSEASQQSFLRIDCDEQSRDIRLLNHEHADVNLRGWSFIADASKTNEQQTGTSENVAQDKVEKLETALRAKLQQILEEEQSPGVTLAVVMPTGDMIRIALGRADVDLPDPLPVGAQMLSGSVGKIFVSTLVLLLTADDKIRLDEKVSHYLGDNAWYSRLPNADKLTVRSLLNHTSGLPRYVFQPEFLEEVKLNPQRTWTPQQCLELIFDKPAVHAVGEGWGYSDTNYQILGMIIERVSGESYYELLKRRLLDPYKLSHTYPSTQAELPGLVQGHIGSNNFFSLPPKTVADGRYAINPQFEWCGGGLVTNVDDLARFAHTLYGGKILPPELQNELIQSVSFRDGNPAPQGYGLGAFVWDGPQGQFVGHAGVMPGYLTQVEYSQKHGFALAIQFNHDQGMGRKHHAFAQRLAEVIIGETIQ